MDSSPTDRRQFAQQAVALAAVPLAVTAAAAQPAVDPAVVAGEVLFAIAQARYGKFLTPAQLDAVKRGVARSQATATLLRQVKLDNGDGPGVAFRADLT